MNIERVNLSRGGERVLLHMFGGIHSLIHGMVCPGKPHARTAVDEAAIGMPSDHRFAAAQSKGSIMPLKEYIGSDGPHYEHKITGCGNGAFRD
jgi:hypothetical protein